MEYKLFADTSWFKGLIDDKDDFHNQSIKLLEKIKSEDRDLVTTNFIIDETFTLLRQRCPIEKVKLLYSLMSEMGKRLVIIRVGAMDENRVWKWFWLPWSNLSYTDCTSFAVMERLGLKEVLTFDEHFSKAGFKIWR
jgi:uncharacterized protein